MRREAQLRCAALVGVVERNHGEESCGCAGVDAIMKRCNRSMRSSTIVGLVWGLLLLWPIGQASAQPPCDATAAKIVSIEGQVEAQRSGDTQWQAVKLDDIYCPGDSVRTLEHSRASFILKNETVIRLDENTLVTLSGPTAEKPTLLQLLTGSAFFMSRYPHPLTIETPYVNAASGGTEFNITVDKDKQSTTITVIEGQMNVTNDSGSTVVEGGQEAITQAGQAPVMRLLLRPRDAIQWALYYPPILSVHDLHLQAAEGLPESDWQSIVLRSIDRYKAGEINKAIALVEGTPKEISNEINDPRFYIYRASLLLSVGQVDQANADITRALTLAPNQGLAIALQSMIAVVQNDKENALQLAKTAVKAEPEAVSVQLALSYAEQVNFRLSEAIAAANGAVTRDPEDGLALARVAELRMAQGDLDKALEAAQRAASISPNQALIQTVLGYANLVQIKTSVAIKAFTQAITLNSADPMPRLGLGLAEIREGNLEQGRKEIEIAANLDPSNSLLRSYLGKAYYEEKRDPLAVIQYDQAKALDPKDPTPYLYEAILEQTTNRPVEALHDIQKSIELNDNRAVYRSKLLLDQDLATRSVSLARIFDDLGFQQLALVEGWKSVNLDPTNYSSHRLLADSYSALPSSQTSQVSELLQSQLLQPLNNNPVQPLLAGNTAILSGASPEQPTFNEYSRLFLGNRLQLLLSGVGGNLGTLGDEVIISGLQGPMSYSVGQFHYETNGYRTNANLRQNIYDGFSQISLTPQLNIQGEVRSYSSNDGDLFLNFDNPNPGSFSPTQTNEQQKSIYRLGLHYSVTPGQDLLASFFYAATNDNFRDDTFPGFPPGTTIINPNGQDGYNGETQYLLTSNRVNLIAGLGYFNGINTGSTTFISNDPGFCSIFSLPVPCTIPFPSQTLKISAGKLYLYSNLALPMKTTLTLGVSGNFFHGFPSDQSQVNPKAGLTVNLTPSTTLRLAVVRVLEIPLIERQTLEPTQVAGFQQFFDDGGGSASWHEGAALDQKITTNLFGGVEYSYRRVGIPTVSATGMTTLTVHDQLGTAYLYWTPVTWLATNASYQYERRDTGVGYNASFMPLGLNMMTNRVPLGLNFFHPSGFFAKFKATYVSQRGIFEQYSTSSMVPGNSDFWLLDASLGYRLPKRLGIMSVEATNLLNRTFKYQQNPSTITVMPLYQPARVIFGKLTLLYDWDL
jgi:tetratricopeptide (TPR) repeat protein